MLRSPIFSRTFGNIEINIWSYPKEIIKCLLKGLSCNLQSHDKIANVIRFRHCNYKDSGGCNCNEKVEEICFKYSIKTHRQGNIFIPIEVSNCDSNSQRVYISELRSIPVPCGNSDRRAINVVAESSRRCACLLRLPIDQTNAGISRCFKDKNNSTDRLMLFFEDMLKHLIKTLSIEIFNNRKKPTTDNDKFLELCLENDISSEDIVSLLKNLKSSKNLDSKCRTKKIKSKDCHSDKTKNQQDISSQEANIMKCSSCKAPLQNLCVKNYKVVRTPSPQNGDSKCPDDTDCEREESLTQTQTCGSKCSKISKSGCSMCKNSVGSYSKCKQDIKDIKAVLDEIVVKMNSTDVNEVKSNVSDHNKQLTSEELVRSLMQQISQCKLDSAERCNSQKPQSGRMSEQDCDTGDIPTIKNSYHQTSSRREDFNEIPVIENAFNTTLDIIPRSIPLISSTKNNFTGSISNGHIPQVKPQQIPSTRCCQTTPGDACDNVETVPLTPSNCSPIDRESQNKAIKHALEEAGIPGGLSEYISKLTPSEFHNGTSNIYYYVNSDTGDVTLKSGKNKPCLTNRSEYLIEQQITPKQNMCEENLLPGYSHIIVDINVQNSTVTDIHGCHPVAQKAEPMDSVRRSKLSGKTIRTKDSKAIEDDQNIKDSARLSAIRHSRSAVKSEAGKYSAMDLIPRQGEMTRCSKGNVRFRDGDRY